MAENLILTQAEQAWLSERTVVQVGYDAHFPPYSFLNDNNELEGLAVDVFELLGRKLGIQFQVNPSQSWAELYSAAENRQVDLVATMVERPERRELFHFTKPYITKSLVIIARGEDQSIFEPKDLVNKRVAMVKGYQYVQPILEAYPSMVPVFVDTMLEGLTAVSTGKADATITFLGAGHFYRTKYLFTNLKYAAVYDKSNSPESIALRRDWPMFASILNKALLSISEAEMHQMRSKWLPKDYQDLLVDIQLTEEEKRWIEAHPEIRLGVDPEFAPFEYIEDERYLGMASDYVKLLNQRLRLNLTIVQGLTWDGAVEKAKSKEVDALPAVGITQERKEFLIYSKPYLNFQRVIITRADKPFIVGLSDLANERVAVQKNSSHHGYLLENSAITPFEFDTLQDTLLAVSGGKADALVGNVASATYWIRQLNLTNLKVAAPVSNEVQSLHFAIRDDWPELVGIINKGLDTIGVEKQREISEKWLNVEYQPQVDYQLIWKLIAGFTLVLLLILLWNFTLNRRVKERTEQLVQHAYYDQLTQFPNRFLIQDRLNQLINDAKLQGERLAVLSIDLDDFKKVNDVFGHPIGDRILKTIAKRIKNAVSEPHIVGRLGGDQFIVVMSHLVEASQAASFATLLHQCIREVISVERNELNLSATVGIALYPEDGGSAEALLKNADSATHHAKSLGHGYYAFYTEKLQQRVERKLKLEEQMRGALQRNEFYVLYQPKIDARTQQVVSFEALARWNNEELGEVSPAEFIPIAENNGLIEPIGMFVLHAGLRSVSAWNKHYSTNLGIAVNFSPRQFRSEKIFEQILRALNEHDVVSQNLEIEITEGVLMRGDALTDTLLKKVERLGVRLAMDDFGTGYSSMSYLRQYNFDVLKIDREFVQEIALKEADRKLVAAAIAMAHNLDMEVVAEGVETEQQSRILTELGCDILQGWLYGKAIPFEQVINMLNPKASKSG